MPFSIQRILLYAQKRNSVISLAYLKDGYSQIEIANHLRVSKSAVSMVIKNDKRGD